MGGIGAGGLYFSDDILDKVAQSLTIHGPIRRRYCGKLRDLIAFIRSIKPEGAP